MSRRETILSTTRVFSLCATVWMVFGSTSAEAIEITDVRWGFDGTARSETFVPLHVLVHNDSAVPFDGNISLVKRNSLGNRIGAPWIKNTVLAPGQQNWIRFAVFLEDGDVVRKNTRSLWSWQVSWSGPQPGRFRIEAGPRQGPPARVLLLPRGDVAAGGSFGVPVLIDELFPPTVTITDTLGTVFLDHVPRWQDAQRRAFRNWLYRGGRVHILHDSTGRYPRFPSSLGMLNQTGNPTQPSENPIDIGQGHVEHHPRGRFDIDATFVSTLTAGIPSPKKTTASTDDAEEINFGGFSSSSDNAFFSRFKQMTTPDHNWLVIFLLAILYWLLLFPGGLVLGMKRIDFRIVLGSILSTIAVFSLGFSWIGARAYDEATVINSLATARHLGGDRWDVQQWSALFVVEGDTYTLTHVEPDPGENSTASPGSSSQLFAVSGSTDPVVGSISNGFNGRLRVDIAPYTLRPFLHRLESRGPEWSPEIIDWQIRTPLPPKVSIRLNPGTDALTLHTAWVQFGDQVLSLKLDTSVTGSPMLVAGDQPTESAHLLARARASGVDSRVGRTFWGQPVQRPAATLYSEMLKPLLSRTLRWIDPVEPVRPVADGRVRLFLVSDLPKTFQLKQPQRAGHAGRALFVQDVVIPASTVVSDSPPMSRPNRRHPERQSIAKQAGVALEGPAP